MAQSWSGKRRGAISGLEARAVRVLAPRGVRIPKELAPEYHDLANRALQRIVDVMEEEVHSKRAKGVLSAAIEIREELCGPKVQKISIEGSLEQILTASLAPAPNREELTQGSIPMLAEAVFADETLTPEEPELS